MRGSSLTGNLSGLNSVLAGLVDILAADYYPAALLHAAFGLAKDGVLPLPEAIRLVCQNPAAHLGLDDRGSITLPSILESSPASRN